MPIMRARSVDLLDSIGTLTVSQDKIEHKPHARVRLFDAPSSPAGSDRRASRICTGDPDRPMAKNLTELKKWESEERGRRLAVKDEDMQRVIQEVIERKDEATLRGQSHGRGLPRLLRRA